MTTDAVVGFYSTAKRIASVLESGKDAAMLCLGDPCVYGTAIVVERKIAAAGFATRIVAGVPSFCATAAALHEPVASGSECAVLLPGGASLKAGNFGELMRIPGRKIIMKPPHSINALAREIFGAESPSGRKASVSFAANVGMDGEKVVPNIGCEEFLALVAEDAYLSLVFA